MTQAALGIAPQVCHLNEGHAAFAVLERARSSGDPRQRRGQWRESLAWASQPTFV